MYIEAKVIVEQIWNDILIAEIANAGFDTFSENENGFDAYSEEENFDTDYFNEIIDNYRLQTNIEFQISKIEKQNWNTDWEKNYDPVRIEKDIHVRATFHPTDPSYRYEIVITPKMSFGTGHHATTTLMLQNELRIDLKDKDVLDAGTGTAILAIMAEILGANSVLASDIDEWCIENGSENISLNKCTKIQMALGTVKELSFPDNNFEIVLANINRNVLLDEMSEYVRILIKGGNLVLSGFYEEDCEILMEMATNLGLEKISVTSLNRWASLLLVKK